MSTYDYLHGATFSEESQPATAAGNTSVHDTTIKDASVWVWLLSMSLFLTAVVTFLGNGLVLLTFLIDRRLLRSNFNVFLINLTFTDISVSITAIPLYAVDYLYGFWPFNDRLCSVWIFCDWGMTFASVYTLLAISVDRYWAVCWSHHYRAHNTRKMTFFIVAAIWCLVLLLWLPPYVNDRLIAANSPSSGCLWSISRSHNSSFAIFMAVAGYHVPSFIIVYCYFRVLFKMKKSQQCLDKQRQLATNTSGAGKQPVMRSTLTMSSFRSTDSDTGSNIRESNATKGQKNQSASDSNNLVAAYGQESEQCGVKIVITDSAGNLTGAGETPRKINHNENLLTLPQDFEREQMMRSNMSLDLPSPVVDAVRRLGSRRPCSFTEGTNPNRTFRKHSPDGGRYHQRNMAGSVRSWRGKHCSALSEASRSSRETVKSGKKNREYRLFIRVTYIVVAYVICWTPFHVVFDCQLADINVDANLYTFAVLMCYLNSTLNPILYALGNPKLKAAFWKTLACAKCKKRHNRSSL